MDEQQIDSELLRAWLCARSVARGLPAPVAEYGGFRVEVGSNDEVRRWVFPKVGPGLEWLGRSIDRPRHPLKLCGTAAELRGVLPARWRLHAASYFMRTGASFPARPLCGGYRMETSHNGQVVEVRILSEQGDLAASGYAVETDEAFIYDRIVTSPRHRRRGLGGAIMTMLRTAKRRVDTPELLVATEEGRSLYTALGWEIISPYSTASVATPVP